MIDIRNVTLFFESLIYLAVHTMYCTYNNAYYHTCSAEDTSINKGTIYTAMTNILQTIKQITCVLTPCTQPLFSRCSFII